MSRYVVTELVGYAKPSHGNVGAPMGLSCMVIDTAWNRRIVATYRSEDYGRALSRVVTRGKAERHAERLNAALD